MKRIFLLLVMICMTFVVNAQHYVVYPTYRATPYGVSRAPRERSKVVVTNTVVNNTTYNYVNTNVPIKENVIVRDDMYTPPCRSTHCKTESSSPSCVSNSSYAPYDFGDNTCATENQNPICINTFDINDVEYTIWFKIDSYKIKSQSDVINLWNVADLIKKYPNRKIVIYAYASANYGTVTYNDNLAARRSNEVRNYLVNGCHIDWSKIEIVNIGSRISKYDIDKWNQSVVVKFN